MEQNITIKSNWWQAESQTDIVHLRDIEFRLLAHMYNSKELFEKIKSKVADDDFTFVVNKIIYKFLTFYANEDDYFGDESKKTDIALNISDIYKINPITTIKILNGNTKHLKIKSNKEENLDLDIFELLNFSKKRQEVISLCLDDEKAHSNIEIEDEYGFYYSTYLNGIIYEIGTTYIFHLPEELCDTFKYTFEKVMSYTQLENYDVTLRVNEDNAEDIEAFCLRKNLDKIEQVERLILWADENKIAPAKIRRNRGVNFEYSLLEEFNDCNLKEIPAELFQVKQNSFFFNFVNNKIKSIPSGISNSRCSILMLCNNEISIFPKSVYELKELNILSLHANKLESIPKDIDKLKQLKHLSISNNPIKKLPSSISNIITLKALDLENTFINEDSLDFLDLKKLEKISFDDRLLPYFIGNLRHLENIDTINLTHSHYSEDDEIIKSLNLIYNTEKWMEDKDYQGHGCIVLSKLPENEKE